MFEESSQNRNGATAGLLRKREAAGAIAESQQQDQGPPERFMHSQESVSALNQPGNRPKAAWRKIKNFRVECGPSRKDILNFTNQLAVMIRAGISLQDSLESIAEQNDNLKFKLVIIDLKGRIESGQSFSQALAEYPQIFSELYINMVAA